jgi:hypothetical protein
VANEVGEIQEAKNWIRDVLAANSDITAAVSTRIFADHYPGSASDRTYPYILYNTMAATDVQGLGTTRQSTDALFQVRAVCQGAPNSTAKLLDKRINDVLQLAVHQQSGDYYFSARRVQAVDRPEYDSASNRYHNLGGIFRVWISAVP